MDTTPPAADVFDSVAGVLHPPPPATTEMYAEGPTIAVPAANPSTSSADRALDPEENAARL
eukprot:3765628-Prorocentrum_lima.AAC.1